MLFFPAALCLDFSIFAFFLFAFKVSFPDLVFFLLRRKSYGFFFFLSHISSYFDFFSLLLYYEFDLKWMRRIILSSLFKRARLGWGKHVYIDRFVEARHFFLAHCALFVF